MTNQNHNNNERKQAEESLRETEEKFRTLAEQSPNMIFINKRGRVVYANKRCEDLMGYTRDEFYSPDFDFLSLIAPESMELVKVNFSKHMKGEEVEPYDSALITKTGKRIETIIAAKLMNYEGERAILGIITDITERKRAEKALAAEKERLAVTLRSIGDGVITTDIEGKIVLMNKVAEKLTGWTQDEAIGKPLNKIFYIINEKTRKPLDNPVEKVLKTGEVVGLANDTVLVARDGTERILADSGAPIRDKDNNIMGVVLVFRDITERRWAEKRYQSLFEEAPVMYVITRNQEGVSIVEDFNELFLSTLGYTRAEVLGQPLTNFYTPESCTKLMEGGGYKRALEGHFIAEERELVTRDDRIIETLLRAVPETDSAGSVFGTRAMYVDITERKRAEMAMKKYSEQLEEMVEQRTKELREAQEELIRKEKLAVLGKLAGGVGHELRNPLGAIKNAAYFLNMVMEDPEPEVKETLEILETEVATSERIISSLLDFARTKPLTFRNVDINNVVQNALSRIIVPESVEVVNQLDEALPTILADPDQLGQVFGNIILNAIQAMPEGGQLTVKSEVLIPEWITISFTDTGIGIPEKNLKKVFEPLFTTKAKGIGLGLAVTKTLVDAHEGTVEVKSEVGKGSTFTIRLPLRGKGEK